MTAKVIRLNKTTQAQGTVELLPLCSVDACDLEPDTRGMCSKHYRRWLRNGSTNLIRQAREICTLDGCGRAHEARGFCSSHYKRWQRHNDPFARLIKGCVDPGCLGRVSRGRYCEAHQPGARLVGRAQKQRVASPAQ